MAWNEPGGGRDRDPWGGKNGGDGPPDLDEALQKLKERFGGLFGGSGGNSNGKGVSGGLIGLALVVVVAIMALSGIYQVDEKERGVVLRFGKYHDTVGPGLHWRPVFIDTVNKVNVTKVQEHVATGLMLTKDENIVSLPVTVQFTVPDAKAYIINVRDPIASLKHATDSAIRHVVGSTLASDVLSEGREKLSGEIKNRLQNYLDIYQTGVQISKVNIGKGEPPVPVKPAFDDVNASRKDRDRYIEEAESYRNGVVPVARGEAQRMIQAATAYRDRVIAEAEGESQRFEKLLVEYQKAPEVTRQRLYLDTVQDVMQNVSKVMVDVEGGNNMLYLPLDQIAKSQPKTSTKQSINNVLDETQIRNIVEDQLRDMLRDSNTSRGNRR
ncbi:FtsH protease activity modulator HflK [bacterium SCSIO 12696]|nr:FtsH protease activity modulator HflK [bacterium SCSIO 12696]